VLTREPKKPKRIQKKYRYGQTMVVVDSPRMKATKKHQTEGETMQLEHLAWKVGSLTVETAKGRTGSH
jgi:hypothetical protein